MSEQTEKERLAKDLDILAAEGRQAAEREIGDMSIRYLSVAETMSDAAAILRNPDPVAEVVRRADELGARVVFSSANGKAFAVVVSVAWAGDEVFRYGGKTRPAAAQAALDDKSWQGEKT